MKKILFGLSAIALLTLSGCVTTPSQPLSFDQLGRYSSTPVNSSSYRIRFEARPNMSFSDAEEITLVKAAQVTLQQGFQFFKVIDDPSNRSQKPPRQAVVYPQNFGYPYGYGYRRYPGIWSDPFYNTPQVINIDPAQVSYTIECYKNHNSAPKEAFDARLILQSLGAKYGLGPRGEVLIPQAAPTSK